MKRYIFLSICTLILFLSPMNICGEGFSGPSAQGRAVMISQPITVSEALNLPGNSWVIISGNIVGTLRGGSYYTFRDSTGEITVEIERKVWRGLSFNSSEEVEIHGYIEISRGQVSVEAKAIMGTTPIHTRPGQAVTMRHPITISEAKNLPDNSWVIITGNIVNEVRRGYFTFRDSTGEILVEIERKAWRGLSIDASDIVEIHGYVEISRNQTSIEVKAIRKM